MPPYLLEVVVSQGGRVAGIIRSVKYQSACLHFIRYLT
jgi:hypothetical protein